MITKKFYFPLLCRLAYEDCWEGVEVSNSYISEIESEIADDLKKYQDFGSEKMHEFFDGNEDVSNKLLSTVWSFEKIDGEYYGLVTISIRNFLVMNPMYLTILSIRSALEKTV